jgi:predicted nicotinamide N-methyase
MTIDSHHNQSSTFGIKILQQSHPAIKKIKLDYPTTIHGNKVWDACYLLMAYFNKNPLKATDKVLEIGCGWGLSGIYLNKTFGCAVTATDADADVFPYLQLHAEANKANITTMKKRFEEISQAELAEYDVVIAADVCFWDELNPLHCQLIDRAVDAGVEKIVYADPAREPFIALAEYCADQHYAQISSKRMLRPVEAKGAIMVINNA